MDVIVDSLHKRTVLAVVYTIVLQSFLTLLAACSNLDIFHPISWISGTFFKLTLFSVWTYFIILCALLTALSGIFKSKILSGPHYFATRFSVFKDFFRLTSLFQASLFVVIGIIISCLYLTLVEGKYSSLYKTCSRNSGLCVVEGKVFIICCAAWAGIYIFLCDFFKSSYCPVFPVIQQLTFLRLKAELFPSLKQSMVKAILPCVIFPFIYFWKGNILLVIVCDVFDLIVEENILSGFMDFFNFPLLLYSWLITTLFIFTTKMMTHVLNILLTNLSEYPVTRQFGEKDVVTLHEVIAARNFPIIQNWGCFDLFNLSKSDYCRRQEIFALSQPGGHPNNWNAIKRECIILIDKFVEDINMGVALVIAGHQVEGVPTAAVPAPAPTALQRRITRQMSMASSSTPTGRKTRESITMRNLSIVSSDPFVQYESFSEENPHPDAGSQFFNYIRSAINKFVPFILRKARLSYLFEKYPDAKLKQTFSSSLPVINAVQGLSFLVAASLTEDTYGVVQKDLDTIMVAVLQLKVAVDKALKFGNFKRAHRNEHDMQMKAALKSAIKRSLYKICVTFKDHIQDLDLPPSVITQLQVYLTFRE